MGRRARGLLPEAGIFHVTVLGAGPILIFRDDVDRILMLQLLKTATERGHWRMLVLCLMGTHYHLVVEARRQELSRALHRVNGIYAQAFNRRHERRGHLFGDRFASWIVLDDAHLRSTINYVVQNPVWAGLCERAADWPWTRCARELEPLLD